MKSRTYVLISEQTTGDSYTRPSGLRSMRPAHEAIRRGRGVASLTLREAYRHILAACAQSAVVTGSAVVTEVESLLRHILHSRQASLAAKPRCRPQHPAHVQVTEDPDD